MSRRLLDAKLAQNGKGGVMAANSAKQQRGIGRPFKKGVSGNPAGKPPGTLNRTTLALQELLSGEAERLTRKCVELALKGDSTALRLCMERLLPPARERLIELEIPKVETPSGITAAIGAVLEAVGSGKIFPGEGQALAALLESQRKTLETLELEQRLSQIEQHIKQQNGGK